MSDEKSRQESVRWLTQARADIGAANASREAGSHEWACFQSQQAAQKALKALWLYNGLDPWGHSVLKLINDLPPSTPITDLQEDGRLLDKLYVPTRYPNGLPDHTPHEVYGEKDAVAAIDAANRILTVIWRPNRVAVTGAEEFGPSDA